MLSSSVSTGRVVGRFAVGVVDGEDEGDEPDLIPAKGTITFTASIPYMPNGSADPDPVTILKTSIVTVLDDEGYLCTPNPANPGVAGKRGVRLFATDDEDAGVVGWTWNATPRFVDKNGSVLANTVPTFSFALPSGSEVDLTRVVKIPSSTGIGKEQAEAMAGVAAAAAERAAQDAATAMEAIDTMLPRAEAGDVLAAEVLTPQTTLRAAVETVARNIGGGSGEVSDGTIATLISPESDSETRRALDASYISAEATEHGVTLYLNGVAL